MDQPKRRRQAILEEDTSESKERRESAQRVCRQTVDAACDLSGIGCECGNGASPGPHNTCPIEIVIFARSDLAHHVLDIPIPTFSHRRCLACQTPAKRQGLSI